jgi:arsenate reductase-like glutaredoxin family protein
MSTSKSAAQASAAAAAATAELAAPSTMDAVARGARDYAEARTLLAELVTALNDGLEAMKREHLPPIRRALERASRTERALRELVQASPQLFVRPRTVVMHGIKVGFAKGAGKVSFEDSDQVVALIEKKLPELADVLILTEKKPAKKALLQLDVKQLKAIGCTVEETGDQVVVKATGSDIDKLVELLLDKKRAALPAGEEA